MKKALIIAVFVMASLLTIKSALHPARESATVQPQEGPSCHEISGTVCRGETLFDIFKKYGLDVGELFRLKEASADIHRLRRISPGHPYKITIDEGNRISSFEYWIDDDFILNISRTETGFEAEKTPVGYDKRILYASGVVEDNLVSSLRGTRDSLPLALLMSDIFAWDIDFNTDIRKGDIFKIVVEGFYLQGEFRKYGNILSAELVNDGEAYRAYRFEHEGKADYYDAEGNSLKKDFLKAPLSFRRISSSFSKGRFHPVLKIYRPHHGLDYAAPAGTPVSAVGDGTVLFAGRKGQYGKLVIIRHPNGWKTYYGHLSAIEKGIRRGRKVDQGMIIGRVGATGLATGPHLHYEVRIKDRPVNPLALNLPRGRSIPVASKAMFADLRDRMNAQLGSMAPPVLASTGPPAAARN